ncbi:MAG: hypothetical protein R2824_27430 [Saprospiraceae bacterium]|nr:hypothetical protein [Lewinella sp.]
MRQLRSGLFLLPLIIIVNGQAIAQVQITPDQIKFTRQAVRRFVFDEQQLIPLATLEPKAVIGMSAMYPATHYLDEQAAIEIVDNQLSVHSETETQTAIWFGGFNPFATYFIELMSCQGSGEIGFEFADNERSEQYFITIGYKEGQLTDVKQKLTRGNEVILNESIATISDALPLENGKLILQMLGSGLTLYLQHNGLPTPIGQSDFSPSIDLRQKHYLRTFQSNLFLKIREGQVVINKVTSALSSGMGLADIRAITYEDGEPLLDQGRLWYTMSIRGRTLPHHLQGVFSLDPTVFDLRFEGIILFDRKDGLLRNEVASHIFFDRKAAVWRGLTTGFSAYARPEEEKQLLAVESKRDPRFGFSVMNATPFGMVGDIEDPHILFDAEAGKWRILTCENHNGYKAIMLESDEWNKDYQRIAGPVEHNSTGTSIQKIGGRQYCFSGSSERKIFVYTYPDLREAGTLNMDLPPWDERSGTRVWPNVVELPAGYPFKYVALMMDRFNYPGLKGPHWTYGALYLYHGYE